jgi:hypothetical protein
MLAFRAPPAFTAEVEAWAKRQPDSRKRYGGWLRWR